MQVINYRDDKVSLKRVKLAFCWVLLFLILINYDRFVNHCDGELMKPEARSENKSRKVFSKSKSNKLKSMMVNSSKEKKAFQY